MKLLSVDNYIEFECIGGRCPISCCGGNWGIPIDDKSMEYYMSVEGEFGDRLRDGITQMNGRNSFRLDEKTRDCVFLDENKLCSIYRNLGPDALCKTCMSYPRSLYDIGDITFCHLTNSCSEVNRMVMQRTDPMQILFDDSEDDSHEQMEGNGEFDRNRFNEALKALSTGIHIIQNRDISLADRMLILILYVERFQNLLISGADTAKLTEIFANPEVYRLFLENKMDTENDHIIKIRVFMMIYRSLMTDSYDHPMWHRCIELAEAITAENAFTDHDLKEAFCREMEPGISMELEQLMVYRFFARFMQGFEGDDYLDKLAYEVVLYSALKSYIVLTEAVQERPCTQEDRILFYSLCGRIDHTKKEKQRLVEELKREGMFETDRLIRLIS